MEHSYFVDHLQNADEACHAVCLDGTHHNRDGPQQDQQLKPRNPPRQACNYTKVSKLWKRVEGLSSPPCS